MKRVFGIILYLLISSFLYGQETVIGDRFENNHDFTNAVAIAEDTVYRELVLYEEDWYRIDIGPGREQIRVSLQFDNYTGGAHFEIYDQTGRKLYEQWDISEGELALDYSLPTGNTFYYVRVFGDRTNSGLWYSFSWRSYPGDEYYPFEIVNEEDDVHTKKWTPLQFGLYHRYLQLPNHDYSVYGLGIGLISSENDSVFGISYGTFYNFSQDVMVGLQVSLINRIGDNGGVAQIGGINYCNHIFMGLQAGAWNYAEDLFGIQAGAVNVSSDLYGMQIGAVNFIDSGGSGLQFGIFNGTFGWDFTGSQIGAVNLVEEMVGFNLGAFNISGEHDGFAVGLLGNVNWTFYGFQIGSFNFNNEMKGIQLGAVNFNRYFSGVQLGGVNIISKDDYTEGVQIGLINYALDMTGLQIGLINVASYLRGVQIGVINVGIHNGLPFMIGVNVGGI